MDLFRSPDASRTGLLAKIAVSTADHYESAYEDLTMPPLDSSYGHVFLERIRAKSMLYFSLAQFYVSQQLHECLSYGEALARLGLSFELIRGAREHLRLLPLDLSDEILIHHRRVEIALTAATKDNSTIYHEKIPASHSLSILPRASLAVANRPVFLQERLHGAEGRLFHTLLPHDVKMVCEEYFRKKESITASMVSNIAEIEEHIAS